MLSLVCEVSEAFAKLLTVRYVRTSFDNLSLYLLALPDRYDADCWRISKLAVLLCTIFKLKPAL